MSGAIAEGRCDDHASRVWSSHESYQLLLALYIELGSQGDEVDVDRHLGGCVDRVRLVDVAL